MTGRTHNQASTARRPSSRGHTSETGSTHSGRVDKDLGDIIGKVVDIPATHFGVDVPEMYYRATIVCRDSARKTAVVVRFHEDGSQYWLPIKDVRSWLATKSPTLSSCTGKAADEFAASVLVDIRKQALKLSSIATT